MGKLLDKSYSRKMNEILRRKDEDKNYRAILNLSTDTTLVWFLKEKYPKVWEEYLKYKQSNVGATLEEVLEGIKNG